MTAESLMKASGKASEEWIEWATAKANWLDPTIRAEDPYFGVREHAQSEEYKKLKKKGYWYYPSCSGKLKLDTEGVI